MSGQATGWVLRHGPHPEHLDRAGKAYGARARGLRAVLVAVADAANRDGDHAHPGTDNVADAALYSRRQTINLLAELVDEGWLEVTEAGGGRGLATVYRVAMEARGKGAVAANETVQSDDGKGAADDPERVQPEPETVQPRLHPNGVATEPPNGTHQRAGEQAALDAGFDRFWTEYPRAAAKGSARHAWAKAVRAAGGIEVIVEGARRFAADPNRSDSFTPHAATWLNAERWADPPLPARTDRPNRAKVAPVDDDRDAPAGRLDL